MKELALVLSMALLSALAPSPAGAGPLAEGCRTGNRPAASLLYPYFEIDLADPGGTTTLISVGNASDQPIVAHVVVWTDWGIPSFAFDLILGASGVRSLNMRSILLGQLPVSGIEGPVPDGTSCDLPIPPPPFDLEETLARHTGQPSPFSGLCYGSGLLGPEVATGFVTIDAVRDCSAGALPTDPGYFDDGLGLATNDNVLFGDFFLVNPGENFAQGLAAVPLVADAELFEPTEEDPFVPSTFYAPWTDFDDADDRTPLSSRHRARFLHGGAFGGTTDLLIWTAGAGSGAEPRTCGDSPWTLDFAVPYLAIELRDESGDVLGEVTAEAPAASFRYRIGGDESLPLEPNAFGTVDIGALSISCFQILPCVGPLQSWVAPLVEASGRFSVGLEATALDDPCD